MFIIGFPNDNINTINATIEYAKKLIPHIHNLACGHLIQEHQFLRNIKIKQLLINTNILISNRFVYKHDKFNRFEIRELLSKCYDNYYLRLSWMFKYLRSFSFNVFEKKSV